MNLTQLLGALTLATGGGLLWSTPFVDHERFVQWSGSTLVTLTPLCITAIALGMIAIWIGRDGELDLSQEHEQRSLSQEGRDKQNTR